MNTKQILSLVLIFNFMLNLTIAEKIIIIGSGVSGMGAAHRIKSLTPEKEVLILEGRDRYGGRVNTQSKIMDFPIDLGSSFIHGRDESPLGDMLEEVRPPHFIINFLNSTAIEDGRGPIPSEEAKIKWDQFPEFEAALTKNGSTKHSVNEFLDDYIVEKNLTKVYADYLRTTVDSELGGLAANSLDNLSCSVNVHYLELKGDEVLFPTGYISLFQTRYDDLLKNKQILFKQNVVSITQENKYKSNLGKNDNNINHVVIRTEEGVEYTADKVIVTVPLGVLKRDHIKFSPPLSQAKQEGIQKLGWGVLNKIFIEFEDTFWPNTNTFSFISGPTSPFAFVVNLSKLHKGKHCLQIMVSQTFENILNKSQEEMRFFLTNEFIKTFGIKESDIKYKQIFWTNWRNEPFTWGSYSNFVKGTELHHAVNLSKNEGLIYFAGEHTNVGISSNVRGAYDTGMREGTKIATGNNNIHYNYGHDNKYPVEFPEKKYEK